MSRLAALFLFALLLPSQALAIDATVEVLREAGPAENRIDLLVVGEGYTEAEQQKLTQDAEMLIEGLFTYEPWSTFERLFNVRLLKAISNESGADRGSHGEVRDTAFDATYGCNNVDRLLCVDATKVMVAAAEHAPESEYIFVLVNDPKYGGSGGMLAVASLNWMALEVLVHEVAHQVARLADEYEDDYPGYPECSPITDCLERNVTLRDTLEELKWASWVEEGMKIPSTPGTPGVGLFEGARYRSEGVYRPESDCMMHSAFRNEFCKVCEESHVLSFLEDVQMIRAVSPEEVPPADSCDEELVFSVETIEGLEGMEITWSLDGEEIARGLHEVKIERGVLPEGRSELVLQVELVTDKVRDDADGVLVESHVFTLEGVDCRAPCDGPIVCDADGCKVEPLEDGSACGASVCTDGLTQALVCQAGACVEQASECGAFVCDAGGIACRTSCEDDAACAEGARCTDGACVVPTKTKKKDGGGCGAAGGGATALGLVLVCGALRRRRVAAG